MDGNVKFFFLGLGEDAGYTYFFDYNPSSVDLPLSAEPNTIKPLDAAEIVHTQYEEKPRGAFVYESFLADRSDAMDNLLSLVGKRGYVTFPFDYPGVNYIEAEFDDYNLELAQRTGQVRYKFTLYFQVNTVSLET